MTPEQIADAQRRLGLPVTCRRDDALFLAIRRFQAEQRLLVTGELDDTTYQRLWETRLLGARAGDGGDAEPGRNGH